MLHFVRFDFPKYILRLNLHVVQHWFFGNIILSFGITIRFNEDFPYFVGNFKSLCPHFNIEQTTDI